MIIDDTLAKWLADPASRLASRERQQTLADAFLRMPAIAALDAALPAAEREGADGVLRLAAALFADEAAIGACLAPLFEAARDDPFALPPLRPVSSGVHRGLLLLQRPALTVQLALIGADDLAAKRSLREGPASISFSGHRMLFRFFAAGGATFSFWEAPEIFPCSRGSGPPCRLLARRRFADGETIALAPNQTFIIDHAPADLVFLQASTPLGAAPLALEYESRSRRLIGSSSTDEASSRTQMMLSLLRAMGRTDAAPLFEALLGDERFYARWQAMRELLALDPSRGLPQLSAMAAGDPHPEVREAAAQTLAMLAEADEEAVEPCLA